MFANLFFAPQPKIGTAAQTGATQLSLTAAPTKNRTVAALLFQLNVNITGTAPGTARGISQLVHDVQIVGHTVDAKGQPVTITTSIDGQALALAGMDAYHRIPAITGYQGWADTVTAATGVSAVGQYAIAGPFRGDTFDVTFNLNAATSTGFTAVASSAYVLTCVVVEGSHENVYISDSSGKNVQAYAQPERTYLLSGHYVVNSTYTGKIPCHSAIVAIDNAELSVKVSALKVGGRTFSAQQAQMAEDAFDATLPSGLTFGAAFAGNATIPPKNPQTGNALGIGEFGGPELAVVEVSLTSSQTMFILERVPA